LTATATTVTAVLQDGDGMEPARGIMETRLKSSR